MVKGRLSDELKHLSANFSAKEKKNLSPRIDFSVIEEKDKKRENQRDVLSITSCGNHLWGGKEEEEGESGE